jgi:hypothetical protein
MAVSARLEIVEALGRVDRSQDVDDGGLQVGEGCSHHPPQPGLDLAPQLLDRIEVRAVRRQIPQRRVGLLDHLGNIRILVGGQVVHDHHVAGSQRRGEELFDIAGERGPIHRPVVNHRRFLDDALKSNRAEHRYRLPVTVRRAIDATFAHRRPTVQTRHVRLGPRFIEEDEACRIDEPRGDAEVAATFDHVGPTLLGGDQ